MVNCFGSVDFTLRFEIICFRFANVSSKDTLRSSMTIFLQPKKFLKTQDLIGLLANTFSLKSQEYVQTDVSDLMEGTDVKIVIHNAAIYFYKISIMELSILWSLMFFIRHLC